MVAFEAKTSIIVLETAHTVQPEHGNMVSGIACEPEVQNCSVKITDFETDSLSDFLQSLNPGDVVNISFAYQRMNDSPITRNHYEAMKAQGRRVEDYTEIFDERGIIFRQMIENNSEVLFVAAAGNGMPLSALSSNGVPLGPRYKIYPAIFEYDNLIKVTSINAKSFNLYDRIEYHIPSYANYSTDYVDVAAPVEVDREGTSFAAPYVSRLTKQIDKEISRKDLKEIYQKSCFIQDLNYTMELFSAYKKDPRGSIIGRIQNMHLNFMKRQELIESIRPVMLVKCGGVIASDVAKKCAKTYTEAGGAMSITQSCLYAQVEEFSLLKEEEEVLRAFWELQEL